LKLWVTRQDNLTSKPNQPILFEYGFMPVAPPLSEIKPDFLNQSQSSNGHKTSFCVSYNIYCCF